MRIQKDDMKLALQVANAKKEEFSVNFEQADLDAYQSALKKMAKKGGYSEQDRISHQDFSVIEEHFGKLLDGMTQNFAKKDDEFKRNTNVADYVMAASDYLLTHTLNELNGAEMPNDQLNSIHDLIAVTADNIYNAKPRNELVARNVLAAQRGKNAAELAGGRVGELLDTVCSESHTKAELGELYAEYQALTKRQQNHGPIWRLFHRKENAAREALINNMKKALDGKISPDNMENMDKNPEEIVREGEKKDITTDINFGVTQRMIKPEKGFGYGEYKNNPEYRAPHMDAGAEKEKIEVKLDEPVAEKSQKVDAPVQSAVEKNLV